MVDNLIVYPDSENKALEPISRVTIRSNIVEILRNGIICGSLKPGSKLVEGELAKQLRTSRAPIREAFRQLQQERLIVSIPYKGNFVAKVTNEDLWELYSLRVVLESFAIRLAVEKATEDEFLKLEKLISVMEQGAESFDHQRLVDADLSFHHTICQLSGHKLLLTMWESMLPHIRRFIYIKDTQPENQPKIELIPSTHKLIVDALLKKDADSAERIIREHLVDMAHLVLNHS